MRKVNGRTILLIVDVIAGTATGIQFFDCYLQSGCSSGAGVGHRNRTDRAAPSVAEL